jgi:hypothetical protein
MQQKNPFPQASEKKYKGVMTRSLYRTMRDGIHIAWIMLLSCISLLTGIQGLFAIGFWWKLLTEPG